MPTDLFHLDVPAMTDDVRKVINDSLHVVRKHRRENTLYDEHGKLTDTLFSELGNAGYWGALVDKRYGGCGFPFQHFAAFLTRMATVEPTVAGLASVHGCIGAVDPVRTFGTAAQKERYLPLLASGRRLSAFALTEPGAGSDLTALKTTAVLDGDNYVVNGEKLFITNAIPGRTIGLVCRIDDKPAVLIVDLPEKENESFSMNRYSLYALRRAHNNGLVFRDFRVPAENLLVPAAGDGLTIAYHGLNLGRVALCANAAGTMRTMLASMLPWAGFRKTYGQPIANRELVQRRIGHMAGLIVGCDALVQWCGGLIDQGYRGDDGINFRFIERGHNLAGGVDSFSDLQTTMTWHQNTGGVLEQVVKIRTSGAAQLQHIAKAPGCDQRTACTIAFQHGVGDNSCCVREQGH